MSRKIIVFSDLDGTLLDHDNYGYAQAEAARLAAQRDYSEPGLWLGESIANG